MTFDPRSIVVESTLDNLLSSRLMLYVAHVVCHRGYCSFRIGERGFVLRQGETMILNTGYPLADIASSADFEVQVVYVSPQFLEAATPDDNYGIRGTLMLFENPIMQICSKEYELLKHDIANIEERLAYTNEGFKHEVMVCAVKALFLDYFQFHGRLNKGMDNLSAGDTLMTHFLHLLEMGEYRRHREVAWFASELCVTPKYLSEVSNRVSGHSAIFWINRFTTIELGRLMRDRTRSIADISEQFGFSSPSYFSRYFQQHFGVSPSEFRG
ncbi:MAG: AraC family transcriptional regulator [Bacteroidaceae bacterium]|nr:AraC family transcriptional regulator [Bacteroidaceae bacterium]